MPNKNAITQYVFLCNSPLQILNAYEARLQFGLNSAQCTLVIVPLSQNLDALILASELEAWGAVIITPTRPSVALGFWFLWFRRSDYIKKWQRSLRPHQGGAKIFLAYTSLEETRIMASWLRPAEIVYLDDGTLTAANLDWLNINGGTLSFLESSPKQVMREDDKSGCYGFSPLAVKQVLQLCRRRMRHFLLLWQNRHFDIKNNLSFPFKIFTVYVSADEGHFVRNQRRYIRSLMKAKRLELGVVHFLGAPLVERKLVREHIYFQWLLQVKDFFQGREVVYVPHPAEGENFVQALSESTGLQCIRFDMPYEIVFAMSDIVPSAVSSWFCSALENIIEFDVSGLELVAFRISGMDSGRTDIGQAAINFYSRHERGSKIRVEPLL